MAVKEIVYTVDFSDNKPKLHPTNTLIKSWVFDSTDEEEMILAEAVAAVAEKWGLDGNDLMHLFPAILRMLKSKTNWSGLLDK